MMKTKCFTDAARTMNARDVEAIERGVQERVDAGTVKLTTIRAAEIGAAQDLLADIEREHAEVMKMAREQHADVFTAPAAAPSQQEVARAVSDKQVQVEPSKAGNVALFSRKDDGPAFDNASGDYNPDLDQYWLKQGGKEINGERMSDVEYHTAIAEYANKWRVESLLEQLGWRPRGSSNVSSSRYFEKTIEVSEVGKESSEYDEGKNYEIRVSDHEDRHPPLSLIEKRFQVNFRSDAANWSDTDISPSLSTDDALGRLQSLLSNEQSASGIRFNRQDAAKADLDAAKQFTPSSDPQAQAKAKSLNEALASYLGKEWSNSHEAIELPDSLSGIRQEIQIALGRDVQPVVPTDERFNIFNGVYIPSQPKTVYVNANSEVGFIQVAGHELWHALKRSRPELAAWYRQQAAVYYKNVDEYQAKLNKLLEPGEKPYGKEAALEELDADFLGDSMADLKFLQQLADASPTKFMGLLNSIRLWLTKIAGKMRGLKSDRHISDVEALRAHLKAVLVAFAEGKPLESLSAPTFEGGALFSRGATEKPDAWIYRFWGDRAWANEQEAREMIRRRIDDDNARHAGFFKAQDSTLVDGLVFSVAPKGQVKLKQPKQQPAPFARIGEPADSEGSDRPSVDWTSTDLADDGTPDSVLQAYGRGKGNVYRAWIDTNLIPTPKGGGIVAGYPDTDGDYDWSELGRTRSAAPPLKVRVGANGKIVLMDGNHRLAWWREQGRSEVPAYVIDERKGAADVVFSRKGADQTKTAAFVKWFSGSKVVDSDGSPLVVYHGTNSEMNTFEPMWRQLERDARPGELVGNGSIAKMYRDAKAEPELHFFAADRSTAETYGDRVIGAYLRIEKLAGSPEMDRDSAIQQMLETGADGAVFKDTSNARYHSGGVAYVVRNSRQIKSATENRGTFGAMPSAFDGASDSFSTEELGNSLPANAEFLGNLAQTRTFKKFGLGGFDAPSRRIVITRVLSVIKDRKIADAVVGLIPVDVVDILAEKQLTPKMLLNDVAMLTDLFAINGDKSVTFSVDRARQVANAIAAVTAKHLAPSTNFGGGSSNRHAALGAWLLAAA